METVVVAIISTSALDLDRNATQVVDKGSYSDGQLDLKSLVRSDRETQIGRIRSGASSLSIQLRTMCRRVYRQRRLLSFVASRAKRRLR
ncbi:hypothetical protein [Burkholderia metallica]|uniref:hypothetical protein n=1 Tax=Burkholderia metallica TaxID=488729 RepID=UPI00131CAAF0|nr:hypothetical protein [Burkholderia metallica]